MIRISKNADPAEVNKSLNAFRDHVRFTPTNLVPVDLYDNEIEVGDVVYYTEGGYSVTGDVFNMFISDGIWMIDIMPHHSVEYVRREAGEIEVA